MDETVYKLLGDETATPEQRQAHLEAGTVRGDYVDKTGQLAIKWGNPIGVGEAQDIGGGKFKQQMGIQADSSVTPRLLQKSKYSTVVIRTKDETYVLRRSKDDKVHFGRVDGDKVVPMRDSAFKEIFPKGALRGGKTAEYTTADGKTVKSQPVLEVAAVTGSLSRYTAAQAPERQSTLSVVPDAVVREASRNARETVAAGHTL